MAATSMLARAAAGVPALGGEGSHVEALSELSEFREVLHGCLTARPDERFELVDAVVCADGPVRTLVGLALVPEHRRGHGALHDAINHGRIEIGRLRRALAALPLPRTAGGRIVLAADVSPWLRPDAPTSPDRLFCHTYGRGRNAEPRHGYGIVQEVDRLSGGRVQLKIGSLYGVLDRLAAEGLVELDREEVQQGRLRRYYRLTDSGARALHEDATRLADTAGVAITRLRARAAGGAA
ncbi:transposase [Nonomuraea angiospora]|uniref:PadR family transcriptional regulator n=1 Tax=Nonomuraea angiospora TaxID=46172 RepID=A0ABR9M5U4_9ACTN|nr:transposase [Nonomuraea angiospora]MBE1588277.1 hypothetical protein [Nonomuraea angiospora]